VLKLNLTPCCEIGDVNTLKRGPAIEGTAADAYNTGRYCNVCTTTCICIAAEGPRVNCLDIAADRYIRKTIAISERSIGDACHAVANMNSL